MIPLIESHPFLRGGAVEARVAHNHEVAGSSPAPAIFLVCKENVMAFLVSLAIVAVVALIAFAMKRFWEADVR